MPANQLSFHLLWKNEEGKNGGEKPRNTRSTRNHETARRKTISCPSCFSWFPVFLLCFHISVLHLSVKVLRPVGWFTAALAATKTKELRYGPSPMACTCRRRFVGKKEQIELTHVALPKRIPRTQSGGFCGNSPSQLKSLLTASEGSDILYEILLKCCTADRSRFCLRTGNRIRRSCRHPQAGPRHRRRWRQYPGRRLACAIAVTTISWTPRVSLGML